jgi:hypothetical protein
MADFANKDFGLERLSDEISLGNSSIIPFRLRR